MFTVRRAYAKGRLKDYAQDGRARRRAVPLRARVVAALERCRASAAGSCSPRRRAAGSTSTTGATASWTPALEAAGVKHRRIYDLRHTYATWSLAAGIDIFTLARRMGTSVKMIDRTYGHLVAGADAYERELLDAFDAASGTAWTLCGRGGRGRCGLSVAPRNDESPACAGLRVGSGSDGTRTRDLRRDRPAL